MKITHGTNRIVILTKNFAYKFPIGLRGIKANKNEYENSIRRKGFVARTEKHWYGLKQERLYNLVVYRYKAEKSELKPEHQHLYNLHLENRIQIGQDKSGCWKFYDYEEIKGKQQK